VSGALPSAGLLDVAGGEVEDGGDDDRAHRDDEEHAEHEDDVTDVGGGHSAASWYRMVPTTAFGIGL
jgi:hypothetical protein